MFDYEPVPLEEHAREVGLFTLLVVVVVVGLCSVPACGILYSRQQYRLCLEAVHSVRYCAVNHPWGYVASPPELER